MKPADFLAQYLASDVQESSEVTLLLLELLDQIASGELESWEGTGNAYTLTLEPKGATIKPEFGTDTEPRRVSLDDFRDALEDWLASLED